MPLIKASPSDDGFEAERKPIRYSSFLGVFAPAEESATVNTMKL